MRLLRLDDSIGVSLVMSYDINDGCCTGLDRSSRYHALILNEVLLTSVRAKVC
jgi:hypothetical protein